MDRKYKALKVAIIAPITWRTPPRQYGPWEQVASVLAEALVGEGVDVTLFATGESITKGKLCWVCPRPLGEYPGDMKVWECMHISQAMERAADFDIIHNHFDFLPLTYTRLIPTPVITTIHGFSSEAILPVYRKYNAGTYYVSISDSDRHPDFDYFDTVYNGIDERLFSIGSGSGEYLLYFGRIHPPKGTHEAIRIAAQANRKLIICGLIQDAVYYQEKVLPYIDGDRVIYKGNVGPEERDRLLGAAIALLHPISFEEPFGLSVAESMICGTPVIAFHRGSMGELIRDRVTGFLVNDVEEAVAAVQQIGSISRAACSDHARSRFGRTTMAQHYLRLYDRVVSLHQQVPV